MLNLDSLTPVVWADDVNVITDTREVNGGFTEIHGDPLHILATFAGWKRAHENMKPGDSPIMAGRIRLPTAEIQTTCK